MPIDQAAAAAALLTYAGVDITKIEDEAGLKAAFDAEFFRVSAADEHPVVKERIGSMKGRINGAIRSEIQRLAKDKKLEIEFDKDEEPVSMFGKVVDSLDSKVTEASKALSEAKQGGASTAEVAQLTKELEKVKGERDAMQSSAKDWEGKFTTLKTEGEQRTMKERTDAFYAKSKEGIEFKKELTRLESTGYDIALRDFKPEFNEDGTVKYVVGTDGKPVMDPTKSGVYRSMADIARDIATKEKLTAANPQGGKVVNKPGVTTTALGTERKNGRQVAPPVQ